MAHQSHSYYNSAIASSTVGAYKISPDDYFGTYGNTATHSYTSSPHSLSAQLVTSNQSLSQTGNNSGSAGTVSYSHTNYAADLKLASYERSPATSYSYQDYSSSPASPSTTSGVSTPQRKDSSEMPSPITFIEEYSVGVSRKERRKQQNRNSQRAFRERTRMREEHLTGQVSELQSEVGKLREQESAQGRVIETLVWENETLKEMLAM